MSRRYEMTVEVKRFDPALKANIQQALSEDWPFDFCGDKHEPEKIFGTGESSLGCGMSEEDFSRLIAKTVLTANKKPCCVNVYATYLEELPYETYSFDEEDMEKWRAQ